MCMTAVNSKKNFNLLNEVGIMDFDRSRLISNQILRLDGDDSGDLLDGLARP